MVSKTSFDFFPSRVALSSYKYRQKGALIESGCKNEHTAGLSVLSVVFTWYLDSKYNVKLLPTQFYLKGLQDFEWRPKC